jgi:hypothetical protein
MPPRLTIVHAFAHQLSQLLPAERVTRTRTLALLVLGLLWAGTVSLPMLAASLPLPARVPSTERRLRRWLANPAVVAGAIWRQLLPALVADRAGQELVLVFDPTPHNARATLLVLGLVQHHRVLPLAWRVVPQQDGPWAESQTTCLARLMREVAAALPPGCTVTLLGDRGVTGSGVIDVCRALGWHYVLRLNAGPRHDVQVRLADDAAARPVWALVTGPGQRWAGAVEIFKKARWRRVQLTIWWDRAAAEPWLLLSDRPGGGGRVREYRRRARGEATYQDCKRRGFALEASRLRDLARLDRLLLALHLALWWGMQLGLRTIRHGHRRRYDRADRRELSVLRLGRMAVLAGDAANRCPPLPFFRRHGTWHYAWLA